MFATARSLCGDGRASSLQAGVAGDFCHCENVNANDKGTLKHLVNKLTDDTIVGPRWNVWHCDLDISIFEPEVLC